MSANNTAPPPGMIPVSDFNANSYGELSDQERKKRSAGICCYSMLGLVSTAAFICGVYSYAYCDFISRYVTLTPAYTTTNADGTSTPDYTTACNDLGYGTEDSSGAQICYSLLQDHGIGFEYWQATIPVDQTACFPYTQLTPWGYVTPQFDPAFNASQWFSILGFIFGGAAWFSLTCATCCRMDQTRLKGVACYFWSATLFQGLSLIMLSSNICDLGFFQSYFIPPDQQNDQTVIDAYSTVLEGVSCTLSMGSKLAISATVLYFICSLMVPFSIVPFYDQRYYHTDIQRDQQNNPNYSHDDQVVSPEQGEGPIVQGTSTTATVNA